VPRPLTGDHRCLLAAPCRSPSKASRSDRTPLSVRKLRLRLIAE
jgi:hypothetical protein